MQGYWWECDVHPGHRSEHFREASGGLRLVQFFFQLGNRGWDQALLSPRCVHEQCGGSMRINYGFPRQDFPLQFAVLHIVGLVQDVDDGQYLPMLWESKAMGEAEPKFDLKYVLRNGRGHYVARGLSKPAIVSRSDWRDLATLYRRAVGTPFPLDPQLQDAGPQASGTC